MVRKDLATYLIIKFEQKCRRKYGDIVTFLKTRKEGAVVRSNGEEKLRRYGNS
jgi:hypothetical protein